MKARAQTDVFADTVAEARRRATDDFDRYFGVGNWEFLYLHASATHSYGGSLYGWQINAEAEQK